MEIISLDEPVRVSIPSANLIRDDYVQTPDKSTTADARLTEPLEALSQTKTTLPEQQVSTRKPVNILESILNAITSTPILSSTNAPLRSSTIFSSSKTTSTAKPELSKRTIDNQTNPMRTTTTEKAVSIFEQIIQSLTQNTPSSTTSSSSTQPATKATTTIPTTVSTTTTTTTTTTTQRPMMTTTEKKSTIQRIPPRTSDITFGTPRSVIENILNSLSSIRSIVETTTSKPPGERVVIITKPTQKAIKTPSTSASTTMATTKRTLGDKSGMRSVTIVSSTLPNITPNILTTTTVDPINGFLNEISTENSLQKRTLSSFISLLNIVNIDDDTSKNNPNTKKSAALTAAPSSDLKLTTVAPTTSTTEKLTTTSSAPPTSTNIITTTSVVTTETVPSTTFSPLITMITSTNSPTTSKPTVPSTTITTPESASSQMITTVSSPTTIMKQPSEVSTTKQSTTISSSSMSTDEPMIKSPIVTTTGSSTSTDGTTTSSPILGSSSTLSSVVLPSSFSVDINSVSISSANDVSTVDFRALQNILDIIESTDSTRNGQTTENAVTFDSISENSISDLPFELISTTKQGNMMSTTVAMNSAVEETSTFENTDISTIVPIDESTTPLDISSNTIESSLTQNNNNTMNTANDTVSVTTSQSSQVLLSPRFNSPLTTVAPQVTSSTVSPNKDYYLFAILPNNTVVRKKPSMYPTKETPYLIVGIYPNNTIIRKFPNGTLVPEEPVIQVRGFDTRENPPDITSNQVTPDRSPAPDDNTLTTVSTLLSITLVVALVQTSEGRIACQFSPIIFCK